MLIWFVTLYNNSYNAVCNDQFNLLPQVLSSVSVLRTVRISLKLDGFQLIREGISNSLNEASKICIRLRVGRLSKNNKNRNVARNCAEAIISLG